MIRFALYLAVAMVLSPVAGCYPQNNRDPGNHQKTADVSLVWDFGKVNENTVVSHDFIFKNDTDRILNITDLNSSCGCTGSKVEKRVLAPQESTVVSVQLDPKGYLGAIQQYVYLSTDNLDNPITRYIIKAEVEK